MIYDVCIYYYIMIMAYQLSMMGNHDEKSPRARPVTASSTTICLTASRCHAPAR